MNCSNITLKYNKNKTILENISLNIQENKINVILGQNGSGKTTLFNSLCRQLLPTSGEITINDKKISKYSNREFAHLVGILFQENIAPSDLTAKELISYGKFAQTKMFSTSTIDEGDPDVEKAMELTNTKQFENQYISELSSGQRQLVWIAMLIVQNSKYILLDEPTTYLDLKNQFEIMNCIKRINQGLKKTVIIILHDLNLTFQYADYVFMLKDKKIKYFGKTKEILTPENIKDIFEVNVKIIENLICLINNI